MIESSASSFGDSGPGEAGVSANKPDVVAHVMSTELLAIPEHTTVNEAIARIRGAPRIEGRPVYVYVVDGSDRLKGVLYLRDLVFADPERPLSALSRSGVIRVTMDTDQEAAARLFQHHGLSVLPVVDGNERLVGTVNSDAVSKILEDEATEDLLKVAGIGGGEESLTAPVSASIRSRLPWLALNMLLDVVAVSVIAAFEATVQRFIALAVILPIISDMGGNVGIQTISLAVRGLAMGEIHPRDFWTLFRREMLVGIVNGLVLGAVLMVLAYFWKGSYALGLVAGIALAVNTVIAGVTGVVLPLFMRAARIDPATASGPLLTTITDFCGFLLTLSLAAYFLPRFEP